MEEIVPNNLNLFNQPPVLLSVGEYKYERINCKTTLGGNDIRQLEFTANADNVYYTDLKESYLMIKCNYDKADGEVIGPNPAVGPINYPLTSIFSNMDMYINNQKVTPNESHMPWINWLHLMTQSRNAKKTYLTEGLWYEDTYSSIQCCNQSDPQAAAPNTNRGLRKRANIFGNSDEVVLVGKIYIAPHNTDRLYLPHLKFDWKFDVAPLKFFSMSAEPAASFLFNITDAAIFLKRVAVSPAISLAHAKLLENNNALYPCTHMMGRSTNIPQGYKEFKFENAFVGNEMPTAVFVLFIKGVAKTGAIHENPFCCRGQDTGIKLQELKCRLGTKLIPAADYRLGPAQTQMALWSTYRALDYWGSNTGPGSLNRDTFENGAFIYGFDLTRDANTGANYSNSTFEANNLSLEGTFADQLPHVFSGKFSSTKNLFKQFSNYFLCLLVIVIGVFRGQIEINKFYAPLTSWS
jgi:hypothetical protein